jgi:MHS family proline/betaine transporter-like MFS transporter
MKRRKPFALGGRLISAALLIPAYWLINHYPSLLLIMAVAAVMKLFLGMAASTTSALITESFPKEIRATTTSICYAAAGTLFGGTAQIIAIASIKWSGNLLAPAIYATMGLLISACAVLLLKDTGQDGVN